MEQLEQYVLELWERAGDKEKELILIFMETIVKEKAGT